jgi:hypothetical protein
MGHKYGTITDTMDVIKTHRKGKHTGKIPYIQNQQR